MTKVIQIGANGTFNCWIENNTSQWCLIRHNHLLYFGLSFDTLPSAIPSLEGGSIVMQPDSKPITLVPTILWFSNCNRRHSHDRFRQWTPLWKSNFVLLWLVLPSSLSVLHLHYFSASITTSIDHTLMHYYTEPLYPIFHRHVYAMLH